jgi:hypothetical protein
VRAVVLAALVLVGCGLFGSEPAVSPNDALRVAQEVCKAYPHLPADAHSELNDEACRIVRRVCVDGPIYPELQANPPALGNRVVLADAGTGDDTREKPATEADSGGSPASE